MCGMLIVCVRMLFFFFKQKTAYEMCISDWSSDVCSSDLSSRPDPGSPERQGRRVAGQGPAFDVPDTGETDPVERARVQDGSGNVHPDPGDHRGGSEEGREGHGCISTCRSRCSAYH